MNKGIKIVFRKEWRDMWRDRRTVSAAFAYSLLGPLLIAVILHFTAKTQNEIETLTLAVAGAEHAPVLSEYLERNEITLLKVTHSGVPSTVPEGADALLVVDPTFQENMQQGIPGRVTLFADLGKQRQSAAASRVRRSVGQFADSIANVRLLARGIAPIVVKPVNLQRSDLSGSGAAGRAISDMLVLFFVLTPFFASLSVAVDITAGERERLSLQSLLAQPVRSFDLVLGKWAVAASFGLIGTIATVILGGLVMYVSPLGQLGIRLQLDVATLASVPLLMVPLCLLVAALQMLIAMSAKSFKEGQTYLNLLSILPAIVGLSLTFSSSPISGIKALLPVYAELNNLGDLLLKGSISLQPVLGAAALTLVLTFAALHYTARRFDSEGILAE